MNNKVHIKPNAKYIDIHHNDVVNIDMSTKKPASEELEEAANDYADKHGFRVPYDGSNNFYDDTDVKASKEGFIAGANWQKEKDNICYEEIFEEEASWKYEQIMKNVVSDGREHSDWLGLWEGVWQKIVDLGLIELPYKGNGDKVKLIIVKED